MPAQLIDEAEFYDRLFNFQRSAFRLEIQPKYHEPEEHEAVASFAAGDPHDPTELPGLRLWFDRVRDLTERGRTMRRVRVHDTPPTDSQRWERWIDPHNKAAGETIHYLTRSQAEEIGLLKAVGDNIDFWLLDDEAVIVMRFDADGRRISNELITDPARVQQACEWRDLAVRHGVLADPQDATTA
ncbi:DUF6879 family protein [Dactylosporangium sp. NPDC000244]|uniref:DUF6879 family protein n=1 Tax=Dactylosporangium sp. NPDC000244 TaxID=3154365 RepID=UPI003319A164